MGLLSDILPDIAVSAVQAVTRGGPRRQYKWNKKAAQDANQMNRENQQWLLEQNKRIQEEQRMYDSAEAQMARYKAAGLNPHLIYGSGGGAGGAFPIDAGSVPGVNVQAPSAAYPDVAGNFLSAGQSIAQRNLAEARADEVAANIALKEIQVDIAKTNPMLNPSVASWVATSMQEGARLKAMESRSWMSNVSGSDAYMKVTAKVNAELEAKIQKLGLNTSDLAIKNKILESKEFENMIKEVQADWLKDGEVTPQHFYQGMMLIMSKMLGR